MIKIREGLHLGDIYSVSKLQRTSQISAVLSLLTPPLESYAVLQDVPLERKHLFIPLNDTPTASLLSILPVALPFIHCHASSGILIHCLNGHSRSTATLLAYLIWAFVPSSQKRSEEPEIFVSSMLKVLKQKYPPAEPSPSFLRQLAAFAERAILAPTMYNFPGGADWRINAGPRERAEVLHCLHSAWTTELEADSLEWKDLMLPDTHSGDSQRSARCRKCRYSLLSRASERNGRQSDVVSVMPMHWMGLQAANGPSAGRLKCPGCNAKVGFFEKTGNGGLPCFLVTTSAVDRIPSI